MSAPPRDGAGSGAEPLGDRDADADPRGDPNLDPNGDSDVRLLLDAAATVTSELTLDGALTRIVEIAGRLVGARYAALGVLDTSGASGLRTFVHHGLGPAEAHRVGDLPRGRGLLGLLIERPSPLRLHDIAEHPASVGFPPHHPPMRSFLGVPVRVRGRVFGNLYLTEKRDGGDFTPGDEQVAVALASTAGVAIENAVLHERAAHRERWLAASTEITTGLVASHDVEASLRTVLDRARLLAGADVGWIVTGPDVDSLVVQALSGMDDPEPVAGLDADLGHTLTRQVAVAGRAVVVPDLTRDPRARLPDSGGWPALGPAVLVPLRAGAGGVGVLALAWRVDADVDLDRLDPSLAAGFAEQAALALQVARARDERERLHLLEDRDRIARDLHDFVIQRLFAVGLTLDATSRRTEDADLTARLESAISDLDAVIADVRRTIFDLGQVEEDPADLLAEVSHLVERAAATLKVRPSLTVVGPVRSLVGPEVAPDLLATLAEALSNAARHADAWSVGVELSAGPDGVTLVVVDDGVGVPRMRQESGLANMRDRAHRHGGTLDIGNGPGGAGTRLTWRVPVGADPVVSGRRHERPGTDL